MYALGIDLGTTFTAAAVWRDGRAEISSLGSRGAAIPSVVVLREDETIITGETAQRRALTSPHRVAREFKRRLGDTTPILLAGVPYSAEALMARVLRAVVDEVSAREGGPPDQVCVSHPANWGPYKTDLLHQAVRSADLDTATFTVEPVAAAVFYARQQRMPDDAVVAVYDLGGGTFDAAVLRKNAGGFEVLGRPEGIERLGGIDFDAAVYAHVSRALDGALEELDDEDPTAIAAVARLRDECIQAKEALSADTDTTIPVLLPNLATEVRLTRAELESMVRPALQDTIDALRRALRSAGVTPDQLHSVLLVGGSSRMPIVSQLVGAEMGRPVAVDAHPKHAVALGAAMVAGATLSEPAATPTPPLPSPPAPPVASRPSPPAASPAVAPPSTRPPVAPSPEARPPSPVVPVAAASAASLASTPPASPPASASPPARPTASSSAKSPVTPPPAGAAPTAAVPPVKETQVFPAATNASPSSSPQPRTSRPQNRMPNPHVRTPDPQARPAGRPPAVPSAAAASAAAASSAPADFWEAAAPAVTRAPATGGTGSARRPGRGRVLAAAAAGAVVVVALGAAGVAALMNANDDPGTSGANPTSSPSATSAATTAAGSGLPADEQCTDEIKANPRWVCLTSAKFQGETLTIRYKANFAGAEPNVSGGYHLHIYGGDGTTPKAEFQGLQAMTPGQWYVEDEKPSVRTASSKDYKRAIGDEPKVCARIAAAGHQLVQDKNGTYVTGNCVPINRDNLSTAETTTATSKAVPTTTEPTDAPEVPPTTDPPLPPPTTTTPLDLTAITP
jgi:molecular chaperone DnaK